jgi:hypothetical protein
MTGKQEQMMAVLVSITPQTMTGSAIHVGFWIPVTLDLIEYMRRAQVAIVTSPKENMTRICERVSASCFSFEQFQGRDCCSMDDSEQRGKILRTGSQLFGLLRLQSQCHQLLRIGPRTYLQFLPPIQAEPEENRNRQNKDRNLEYEAKCSLDNCYQIGSQTFT